MLILFDQELDGLVEIAAVLRFYQENDKVLVQNLLLIVLVLHISELFFKEDLLLVEDVFDEVRNLKVLLDQDEVLSLGVRDVGVDAFGHLDLRLLLDVDSESVVLHKVLDAVL